MADYSAQFNQDKAKNHQRKTKVKKNPARPADEITSVEFFLVFCLAILKDSLDWISLLVLGIGLIFSRITNIVITGILWLWCLMRLHRFPAYRFAGSFFIEMVPVIGTFSPTWTMFIVSVWAEQRGYMPKWAEKFVGAKA